MQYSVLDFSTTGTVRVWVFFFISDRVCIKNVLNSHIPCYLKGRKVLFKALELNLQVSF